MTPGHRSRSLDLIVVESRGQGIASGAGHARTVLELGLLPTFANRSSPFAATRESLQIGEGSRLPLTLGHIASVLIPCEWISWASATIPDP
jgi:hypothetical protein